MPEPNLDLLKEVVQRVLASQEETREDLREIKSRIGRLEGGVANLCKQSEQGAASHQSRRPGTMPGPRAKDGTPRVS